MQTLTRMRSGEQAERCASKSKHGKGGKVWRAIKGGEARAALDTSFVATMSLAEANSQAHK